MKWISIDDELPKQKGRQRYLVIADKTERTVLYREYYDGWDFEPEYGRVTHWMPLPPPPSSSNELMDYSYSLPKTDLKKQLKKTKDGFGNATCGRCGKEYYKTYFVICGDCLTRLHRIARGLPEN